LGLTYGELTETPVGPVSFIAGDRGIRKLAYASLIVLKERQPFVDDAPSLKGLETIGTLLAELNEYFFGIRKIFTVDIDWAEMSDFQRAVLEHAASIPYGEVRTYQSLATDLGKTGAARAVGTALANNPIPILIPCHRVIGSDQRLRGYAAPNGVETKAFLLNLEGHSLDQDRLIR